MFKRFPRGISVTQVWLHLYILTKVCFPIWKTCQPGDQTSFFSLLTFSMCNSAVFNLSEFYLYRKLVNTKTLQPLCWSPPTTGRNIWIFALAFTNVMSLPWDVWDGDKGCSTGSSVIFQFLGQLGVVTLWLWSTSFFSLHILYIRCSPFSGAFCSACIMENSMNSSVQCSPTQHIKTIMHCTKG